MRYLTEPEWFALNVVKEGIALTSIAQAVAIALVVALIILLTP